MTASPQYLAYTAVMHGGPRDGETTPLPWAVPELEVPVWDDNNFLDTKVVAYRLRGPWRGQQHIDYEYVDPTATVPEDAPMFRGEFVRLAAALILIGLLLIAISDALHR